MNVSKRTDLYCYGVKLSFLIFVLILFSIWKLGAKYMTLYKGYSIRELRRDRLKMRAA